MIQLREYQERAIEQLRAAVRARKRRILLCAPTGSGKTVIASQLLISAIAKGKRILFLAHRRELIRQPFTKLLRFGVPPEHMGIEMSGVGYPGSESRVPITGAEREQELWDLYAARRPHAPLQIASIQTLANRTLPPADLIVIDEAHRSMARSYRTLVDSYPNAVLLGLTATPVRKDGQSLADLYQELVVTASYSEIAAGGHLLIPTVWSTAARPDLEGVAVRGGDYVPEQLERAVNQQHLVGDIVAHYLRHHVGPTLVFATGIAHSMAITERLCEAGVKAAHLDGTTKTALRDQLVAQLAAGEIDVISNCDVLCEGTDIPQVGTVVLARPTHSVRIYLQQVGRGSRPYGEQPFVVLDHAGCALEHGLPQEDREWSLEAPKKKRRKKPQPRLTTRECPGCFRVVPRAVRTCPACGLELAHEQDPPEEQDGELQLLEAMPEPKRWQHVKAEWAERNAQRVFPLKSGWCYHRYRELWGCEPQGFHRLPRLSDEEKSRLELLKDFQTRAEQQGRDQQWAYRAATQALRAAR